MNRESVWYKKNSLRYVAGAIAIFLIFQAGDFIIHGFLLGHYFKSISYMGRPDVMSYMWIMYVGSFIFSFLMMYIFIKGFEDRGIMEGVRFGLLFGTVTAGMGALYLYILFPVPFSLVIQWFGYQLVKYMIAGVAAGAIYKPLDVEDVNEEKDDMEIV